MTIEGQTFYPGEMAAPREVLRLADEYKIAATTLAKCARKGEPLSSAPFRLVAIHALELYLNTLLLAEGVSASEVRGLQHDLAKKAGFNVPTSLKLRKRTEEHLRSLSERREYLASRYDPAARKLSEINRLAATLKEIADKVTVRVDSIIGTP